MHDFWVKLFDTSDFPARWRCGNWDAGTGWLHIISDLGVWSAYLAIPIALAGFARRRKDVPFRNLFWLFSAFILLCGTTHLLDAAVFWWPAYRLTGVVKMATAVVSWATVITLLPVLPKAFAMRTPEDLQREVNERRQTEIVLRASEERFRLLVNGVQDYAIFLLDPEGHVTSWNAGAERIKGFRADEIVGRHFSVFYPPEAVAAGLPALELRTALAAGRAEAEGWRARKDGTRFWGNVIITVLRGPQAELVGYSTITRDLTERRAAEAALRESDERFRAAFDHAAVGTALVAPDGQWLKVNQAMCALLGRTEAEVLATNFQAVTHPKDLAADLLNLRGLLAGEIQHYEVDKRYLRPDGGVVWCHLSVSFVPGPTGRPAYFISQAQDLTERVRSDEALHLRDRALEAFEQGVCIANVTLPGQPIVYVNPGFERMTGYTQAELVGRNCRLLQGTDTDSATLAEVRAAVRAGRPCLVELLNYRKDGAPFWNALSLAPVYDSDGRLAHMVGVQTDVTKFKQLEEQLRQSQKMEAIGQLAGGVAHDFNNLLTIILGCSEMILGGGVEPEKVRPLVEEVHKAGERATRLTRQLLAFSRKQILQPRVLDLNDLVADVGKMITRLIGENIRVDIVLQPGLWRMKADPGQLEQVLMNLAVNARDAMLSGGQLSVETRNTDVAVGLEPQRYVELVVSDTGCGMDAETLKHIFEPFFTTKGVGQGTGLGLATVFGIVAQSGGRIDVASEPGRGTTFRICLPAVEEQTPAASKPSLGPPPRGTETVLLVEDEDSVRSLARIFLQTGGYTVLEASDGEEAVGVSDRYEGTIDLLLLDVVMPGMSGRELADQLRARRPGVPVVYVSGYTDDTVLRNGVVEAESEFLQKPFSMDLLLRKMHDLLAKNGGPRRGAERLAGADDLRSVALPLRVG